MFNLRRPTMQVERVHSSPTRSGRRESLDDAIGAAESAAESLDHLVQHGPRWVRQSALLARDVAAELARKLRGARP
jgi:hypothetical protein